MVITYCNDFDDLSFLLNKKVVLNCGIDSHKYAGIITTEHHKNGYDYLVFVGNNPYNCEIKKNNSFDSDISNFKTCMYVGEGAKQFGFAIEYSENPNFKKEWNRIFKENGKEYSERVNNKKYF